MLLAALAACGPRIDPGPIAADEAARAAAWVAVDGGDVVAIATAAGASFDPSGREGTACRIRPTGGAAERCGRDVHTVVARCVDPACAAALAQAWVAAPAGPLAPWAGPPTDPADLAVELLDEVLYVAHPYGHLPAGRAGTAALLGPADLAALQPRWARATTAFAAPGALAPAVAEALAALPGPIVRPRPLIHAEPPRGPPRRVVEAAGPALAAGGVPAALPDVDAAWLAAAALAAQLTRELGAPVAVSWGDLAGPGVDLGGPRQDVRLALVLRDPPAGAPAAIDAAWATARAGALAPADIEAGRQAVLTALADPAARAVAAAAHASLGQRDPARVDWAAIPAERVRVALLDAGLPERPTQIAAGAPPDATFAAVPAPTDLFR